MSQNQIQLTQQIKKFIESKVYEKDGRKMIDIENSRLDFSSSFVFLGFTKSRVKLGEIYLSGPQGIKFNVKYGILSNNYLSVLNHNFLLEIPEEVKN